MRYKIRPIRETDNETVAGIIRDVMAEFGAAGHGFSNEDAEVSSMYQAYQGPGAAFFVVEAGGRVLGCGGFGPLAAGPADTCELRKMYFRAELRGHGVGRELLERCVEAAGNAGYARCYLETTGSMKAAQALYGHHGFEVLPERMGDTGHYGCGTFMLRTL